MPQGVPGAGAQAGCSQPHHRREDQVGVMKIMSRKAPKGICFHTLKTKDAHPHLEPGQGFYCLEGVPGKWGGGRKAPPNAPASLAHSAHKAQSPSPDPPHAPRPIQGKTVSRQSGLEAKPNTLSVPRLRRQLAPRDRVCSEPTGALAWGRALLLEWKAEAPF